MHSLLLKIFLAYWVAAGVVIIAADLQPHKLIHTPELSDALDSSLGIVGHTILESYHAGECARVAQWHVAPSDAIELVSAEGKPLCGDLSPSGLEDLVAQSANGGRRVARDFARYQVIAVPLGTAEHSRYVLLLKSGYTSAVQVFGFLPGIRTLEISIVVTLFLAVLIVLPLRRLRAAARRITDGDLAARVEGGFYSWLLARIGLRDDIDGLMRDFNAMASRLQSLVTGQKLLLRDISHELRSPLARLAVALESARDLATVPPASAVQLHLDRIEKEADRLNNLIGHILSLSYMETIRELHHRVELSLSSVVEELLPDVQYEAQSRECRIVTCAPRDLIVKGDSDMLRHALENIVRNAIRYSPPGGTVEIDLAQDDTQAVLRVADTGPGVAEDKLSLILNPFYRASDSRRGSTSGFGIGLAIADRAAHLHAGQIVARNREGGGLVVELSLPLACSAT